MREQPAIASQDADAMKRYHLLVAGPVLQAVGLKILNILAVLLLLGVQTASAAVGSALTPEQARVLEAVRASALQYSQNLPNFICTQVTLRTATADTKFGTSFNGASSSRGGSGGMGSLPGPGNTNDVIEERLTYFDQFEHYEVVAVNGKKASGKEHMQFAGAISAGEFGSGLRNLFDLRSHATFSWDKTARLGGRSLYVFKFEVPRQNGTIVMDRDTDQKIFAAYSGRLFVDGATQQAVRITSEIELPIDFPIKMATIAVDYKPVEIGGTNYSLPSHSEVRMKDSSRLYVNRIEFRNYHRFAVESTIHYGSDAPQPKQ
jgi:hypothetical protein